MCSDRVLKKAAIVRKQKEVSAGIEKAIKAQNLYHEEIDRCSSTISYEKAKIAKSELLTRLRETPVSELAKYRKGLPIAELQRAGITSVNQLLGVRENKLTSYRGIGNVKANKTVAAVEQLRAEIGSRVKMPLYEELDQRNHGFLQALYTKKVLSGIRLNPAELARSHNQINEKLKQAKKTTRWYTLWFGRKNAIKKASDAHIDLVNNAEDYFRDSPTEELSDVLKVVNISQSFSFLKEQYLRNSAEYASFYYSEVNNAHKNNYAAGAKSTRLGVPTAELAEEIDSLILDVSGLDITLRGYQEFGIKYLVSQRKTVLGDEMGLGKTIQAIGAFVHLHNTQSATHCLVVAPAGLVPNWEKEIMTRTSFNTWKLHGYGRDVACNNWARKGGIAVVSYATLRNMWLPPDLVPDVVIADEAHYIKNPDAKRTQVFKKIARRSEYVSLLSGTPMENKPEEFVSVMESLGSDYSSGAGLYEKPKKELKRGSDAFASAVAPIYLRRNQEDVLHELPDRLETLEWVEQGSAERNNYINSVLGSHAMQIRQATTTAIQGSAKIQRLTELLEHYCEEGRKVVIFSFFHSALDAACELLPIHFRIDGKQGSQNRLATIDEFSAQSGFAVLVSQIDAGGVGLNMQAASVVVLMEPQLKPTTEWQAIARVHRMGQARRVAVHRLLATDTIDERLHQRLAEKSVSFHEYASRSEIKDSIGSATDQGNMNQGSNKDIMTMAEIVAIEQAAINNGSDNATQAVGNS